MTTTVWKAETKAPPTSKRKHTKRTPEIPAVEEVAKEPDRVAWLKVSTVSLPETSLWLRVTSLKTGYDVYVPLPIRLIQVIPTKDGQGGCLVRGAHGDETTAKEGILEILGRLNGAPLGGASEWQLAG